MVVTRKPAALIAAVFPDPIEKALVLEQLFAHADWVALDRGTLEPEEAAGRAAARTSLSQARLSRLLAAMPRSLTPIPASLALVDELCAAGQRVLALSNLHRASLARLARAHDVFRHFDGRLVSCEVGSCRPEAAIYERLLADFALEPATCVLVDDCRANLDAAAEHGMLTIEFEDACSCRRELRRLGFLELRTAVILTMAFLTWIGRVRVAAGERAAGDAKSGKLAHGTRAVVDATTLTLRYQ